MKKDKPKKSEKKPEPSAEFPPEAQPEGGKGEGRRSGVKHAPDDQRKGAAPGKKESRA